MPSESKKALVIFLALTFGLTVLLLLAARWFGVSFAGVSTASLFTAQMVIFTAMFIPGLSAIAVQKLVRRKPLEDLGFVWGPRGMYVRIYLVILFLFALNYAITWVFFLKPDWTLDSFLMQYASTSSAILPVSTSVVIAIFSFITLFLAPIGNMVPALGGEIGWRGLLLPLLEPLGRLKAVTFSSALWALWHTPMILLLGFFYGADAWTGAFLHFAAVTGLGVWMGSLWLKTRSTMLTAFVHAMFNAHAYGVWTIVFAGGSRLVVGPAGLVGASLCLCLGALTLYKIRSTMCRYAF